MTRWLPIETAPKDRGVLVRVPEARTVPTVRGLSLDRRKVTDIQLGWWDEPLQTWLVVDDQAGGYYEADPSHWFDIPAADEGFE